MKEDNINNYIVCYNEYWYAGKYITVKRIYVQALRVFEKNVSFVNSA